MNSLELIKLAIFGVLHAEPKFDLNKKLSWNIIIVKELDI